MPSEARRRGSLTRRDFPPPQGEVARRAGGGLLLALPSSPTSSASNRAAPSGSSAIPVSGSPGWAFACSPIRRPRDRWHTSTFEAGCARPQLGRRGSRTTGWPWCAVVIRFVGGGWPQRCWREFVPSTPRYRAASRKRSCASWVRWRAAGAPSLRFALFAVTFPPGWHSFVSLPGKSSGKAPTAATVGWPGEGSCSRHRAKRYEA